MADSGQYPEIRTGQGLVPEMLRHAKDGVCLGTGLQNPLPCKRDSSEEILAGEIQTVNNILIS